MIVYRHRRLDNNEIFYVGIGKSKYRATNKSKRSEFWKRITNKTDYSVEIIAEVDTWEEACELEQLLIQEYGRKDLGLGSLVNMTDGGDGSLNMESPRKGVILSEETKNKISQSNKGRLAPNKKKVICTITGFIWNSVKECANHNNINYSTLKNKLNGSKKNNTNFIIYE